MQLSAGLIGKNRVNKLDLRADLESRIYKPKKKNDVLKWIIFLAIAICSFSTLLYVNRDMPQIEISEKEARIKLPNGSKTLLEKSEEIVIKPSVRKELLQEGVSIKKAEPSSPGKKQTIFNDENYQPLGSVNSMVPPPSKYYDAGEARSKAQVNEVYRSFNTPVTTRTIPWQWKSEKSYRKGTFTYKERNGKIDTNAVCLNYKYGSFEYRDCRKAAKRYFQNACSSEFKAACAAGEMIP